MEPPQKPRRRKSGFVKLPKDKSKNSLEKLKKSLALNTEEFLENSSLHGLRYLINRKLHPMEKAFFGISFIIVVLTAVFFILKVYEKWNRTPVIYSINPEASYITNEPFPAVTICNLNQAYKSKAEQFSIFSTEYAMLQLLCKREVNITVASSINDWSNLKRFIEEIAQPCTSMLLHCRFGSVTFNCSDIFHTVVTDEGLCCMFNMVHPAYMFESSSPIDFSKFKEDDYWPVDWSPQSGYTGKRSSKFYPQKAAGTGETLGLSVTLNVEADNYYCSSANSIGFKILLHNPIEQPSMHEVGLLLAAGYETKVRVKSLKSESDTNLRTMNRKYRGCLFQDEVDLKIFKKYTQRNCEVECLAKLLLQYCGCIPHYTPPLVGNETVCSIYDATCLENIRISVAVVDNELMDCSSRCWPSCFDMTYEPDFFTTKLEHSGFQIRNEVVKNMSSEYVERNIAIMNVYYKERIYRSHKQSDFIGGTDFLASAGGLVGLFFGFSFISLAEIIFYTFIHPWRSLDDHKSPDAEAVPLSDKPRSVKPATMKTIQKKFKRHFQGRYVEPGKLDVPTHTDNGFSQREMNSLDKQSAQHYYVSRWYAQNRYLP